MNELEKVGFATFVNNGDGWERIPNAKFMMRDENGTEIEMTPREVINQLYQDNKTLGHYIYNLQSKIDKAIEFINSQRKTISKSQADLFNEDRDNKSKLKVGTFMWNVDELLNILKEDK